MANTLALSLAKEILKTAKTLPERLMATGKVPFDIYLILDSLQRLSRRGHVIQDDLARETGIPRARVSNILNSMDQALVSDPDHEGAAKECSSPGAGSMAGVASSQRQAGVQLQLLMLAQLRCRRPAAARSGQSHHRVLFHV